MLSTAFAILRAAARVAWLAHRSSLPELVAELRTAPRSQTRIDPDLVLRMIEPLLPLLPPYRAGKCVKRSLLLLDLWSRAGLEPSFHLGIRASAGVRGGHAWVTSRLANRRTFQPGDVVEAWRA